MPDEPFHVVHADARSASGFEIERELLEAAGATFELRLRDDPTPIAERAAGADALLVSSAQVSRALLEQLPRCRVVVRYGVGLDTVDVAAATDLGIVVAYFPDFCQPEVANHATLLLLACAKKLIVLDRAVRDGSWRPGPLEPMAAIHGETLGLVGFGAIAREVAVRGAALGCTVIAHDPYMDADVFEAAGVERVAHLDELLERADYVSLHVPLTAETTGLIGPDQLRRMRPTATLINTARGPVVQQDALIEALREGRLGAAGLDVFEEEPLPADSPLTAMHNVVLTPHTASYSDEAFGNLKRRVAGAAIAVMQGRQPEIVAAAGSRRAGGRRV
ncbi:MAG: C-terminal binding protein [Chloroflexi bacterium]|nr:C-terminal binding protein [Chloroflexota bacterium]